MTACRSMKGGRRGGVGVALSVRVSERVGSTTGAVTHLMIVARDCAGPVGDVHASTWPEHRLVIVDVTVCGSKAAAARLWRGIGTLLAPGSCGISGRWICLADAG